MANSITFFLIDDDADDTSIFEEVLHEINPSINLLTAINGQEALAELKKENTNLPNLIFLDLNMPLMGGKGFLAEIKKDAQLRHIPVIIYTTSSQSKDIEETMINGAVGFITKPSSMKDLGNILSSIAGSLPYNLEKALRQLSKSFNTFIVC